MRNLLEAISTFFCLTVLGVACLGIVYGLKYEHASRPRLTPGEEGLRAVFHRDGDRKEYPHRDETPLEVRRENAIKHGLAIPKE